MLLKHQPLAIAIATLFLLLACNGSSSQTDDENIDHDYPKVEWDIHVDNDTFDPDKPDPRCEGWRRWGDLLWWEQPFCCYTHDEAEDVCSKEKIGGRLPFIYELRMLIKDCNITAPGGDCVIGDSLLSTESWRGRWDISCKGCDGKTEGGYSRFGDTTWYWSDTVTMEHSGAYWGIDFGYASIGRYQEVTPTGSVRCVHSFNLKDINGDPTWESTCPYDTRDDVISPDEMPDYDYLPCAKREEEVWHANANGGEPLNYDLYSGYTYITANLDIIADSPNVQEQIWFKDLSAFSGLKCIGMDMRITFTDELESLHGLESLLRIGGNLEFRENSSLVDITALSNLTEIPGDILIYSDIPSLEGLHNITKTKNIHFLLSDVESLAGLSGLEEIKGLGLDTVRYLNSLEGLENVKKIRCMVSILDAGITSLKGLSGLDSLAQECEDYDLKAENLPALSIRTCPSLISLEGMTSLTQIPADLEITNNESLETLVGLGKISFLDGDLIIDQNKSLNSLAGIENLKTVTESIKVIANLNLADITALYNLDTVTGDLIFSNNPKLPTCQCEHLRSLLEAKGWVGTYDFSGTDTTGTCE